MTDAAATPLSDLSLDAELDAFLNRTELWASSTGSDSSEPEEVPFEEPNRRLTEQAFARRAHLARYVKGIVGACALLCMVAAARVGVTSPEGTLTAGAPDALSASVAR
jgi:hypothetical protein